MPLHRPHLPRLARRRPTVSNIASFWCFGIPLSYYLAFPRGLGIRGLWWGLFAVNCEVRSRQEGGQHVQRAALPAAVPTL